MGPFVAGASPTLSVIPEAAALGVIDIRLARTTLQSVRCFRDRPERAAPPGFFARSVSTEQWNHAPVGDAFSSQPSSEDQGG